MIVSNFYINPRYQPEVEENPNDGKSKRGYEKHEKVIVAMEDVALMTRITSSVLSSIVCMYWL